MNEVNPSRADSGPDGWPSSGGHIAKFHYTGPTRTRHGPDRTRPDPHGLFCGETPLGPCGSPTKSVRVRSGPRGSGRVRSGPCRARVVESHARTVVDSVVRATMKVNGRGGNLTPRHPKTPQPMVTKICVLNYVGDIYHHAKFYPNRFRGFGTAHA